MAKFCLWANDIQAGNNHTNQFTFLHISSLLLFAFNITDKIGTLDPFHIIATINM